MQMRMGNPFAYCEASASPIVHEDGGFASSGRPACALSGEKPGLESHSFICPAKVKKRGARMHTPWMTQHPLYCYLASFLTFFILCNIALASVKLAERYSRKRYLSTHTVGRK